MPLVNSAPVFTRDWGAGGDEDRQLLATRENREHILSELSTEIFRYQSYLDFNKLDPVLDTRALRSLFDSPCINNVLLRC